MATKYGSITVDHGAVTLPAESGKERETRLILEKWGADAVRDSDGTELSPEIRELNCKVFSTVCLVRADQAFARKHMDKVHQHAVMSDPVAATGRTLTWAEDPKKWWQVFDRSTGELLPKTRWSANRKQGTVTIRGALKGHLYTVNFWAYQIWDPTSMFNHIINRWKAPHKVAVDPIYPEVRKHLFDTLETWLDENPQTDVVRLTTFFYHFPIYHRADGWDKQRDPYGYLDCASPRAFREFEKATGIKLTLEDIVDEGHYHSSMRPLSPAFRAWMDFIHDFVTTLAGELIERVHRRGKRTLAFLGDHWIGCEPYRPTFARIGLDSVVGAVETGVQCRHLTDIPHKLVKELRLGPYFFDICFQQGGDVAMAASQNVWVRTRRALLRQPADRIGWGGYLHVPLAHPRYVEHIQDVCRDFRTLLINSQRTISQKSRPKVAVLTYWGKMRSWSLAPIGYERFTPETWLEILAGLPFDVSFLSFEEVLKGGVPRNISVLINGGRSATNWSGGACWADGLLAAQIRQWVRAGGGFIGIDEPAAVAAQGRFFQLSDVLGVEKEIGYTTEWNLPPVVVDRNHFIVDEAGEAFRPEEVESFVSPMPSSGNLQVLAARGAHILAATNRYAKGRSVYLARASFSWEAVRLLHLAILWASRSEGETRRCYSTNHLVECAYYPKTGRTIAVNNSPEPQTTLLYDGRGRRRRLRIAPYQSVWV
jgi:1,3-beta-galactosyl-N-acetylhexosamine phosphorylase